MFSKTMRFSGESEMVGKMGVLVDSKDVVENGDEEDGRLRRASMKPRENPVVGSTFRVAFHSNSVLVQNEGYLKRATSATRTISRSALYPAMGMKCPPPVCWRVDRS